MTTREDQVQAVARIIAEHLATDGAYGEPVWSLDYARRVNREGWTVVFNAPLGSTIRYEGVVLSDEELRRAYEAARALR